MLRAEGTPSDGVILATSLLATVVAHLDLFGAGVGVLADWGEVSLFSYAAVLAFLVPAVVVVREWRRHGQVRPGGRGPDVILGAAAVALGVDVVAHLIGEGAVPGLLAAVLASVALGYAAARLRT